MASLSEAVIYGEDDRKDVYEVENTTLRELALYSSPALLPDSLLRPAGDGFVGFETFSLRESVGLCDSERFGSQPALANCSGTLVDDDLVLTAAHCVDTWRCDEQVWAFGYAVVDAERGPELREGDLYRCRGVPMRAYGRDASGSVLDYAFVQLHHPVEQGPRPAKIGARDEPAVGDELTVIGYPNGIPVKIADSARVFETRPVQRDHFSLTSDAFFGSSGSGVFNRRAELVGALVRGGVDYVYDEGRECFRARVVLDGDPGRGEQASYAATAVEALCDSGWPSVSLCDRSSVCGDGWCSLDEHAGACSRDCPAVAGFGAVAARGGGCVVARAAANGGELLVFVAVWMAAIVARIRTRGDRRLKEKAEALS
jgi:hypothetical protein